MNGTQADIVGFVEMGLRWHKIPTRDRLWERTRDWFESLKVTAAYNRHDNNNITAQQWGGTSLWSINNAAHRAIESGSDPYDLGRWSWTRYRGRGNITLRVICAYRPCDSSGSLTVYAQHQNYFDDENIEGCPRELFTTHILAEIDKWIQEGDQIILMLDANEDIRGYLRFD
jgi:hypothetical protein